jgi:hypothetical protein
MSARQFAEKFANVKSVFNGLIGYVSLLGGLWYVCDTVIDGGDPLHPLIWACTVTFSIFVFFGLFLYCLFAQSLMQDELGRVTKVKEELETLLLKRRLSSKGGKK